MRRPRGRAAAPRMVGMSEFAARGGAVCGSVSCVCTVNCICKPGL